MLITFDELAVPTVVTNQYPDATFSSQGSYSVITYDLYNYGTTLPSISRGNFYGYNHFAPLVVDFPVGVNELGFHVTGVDQLGGIALLDIYQNGVFARTEQILGYGNPWVPVWITVGAAGYNNVTRIVVRNITDTNGIGFDNLVFTVPPAPSPTPTPTPTPSPSPTPFPPTNLRAEGHIEEITIVWDLSATATSYNVKRRTSIDPWTVIATGVQPETSPYFGIIGRYRDNDAIPDTTYYYAVTAANSYGESGNSNVVSAMLAPSCGDHVEATPALRQYSDSGNGWAFTTQVSDRDGFVASEISLNGRYMAKTMSVPYFFLKTNRMPSAQRGELTANGDSPVMRARLLRYEPRFWLSSVDGHIMDYHLIAQYGVDRLTPTSKSCLLVTQEYVFNERRPGHHCEPSGALPCSEFVPKVSYEFVGRAGETLESMRVAQRLHYRVNGQNDNTIGLFRDCDVPLANCGLPPGLVFKLENNPLTLERGYPVVRGGRDIGSWDNIHQTWADQVAHPLSGAMQGMYGGCPECVHTHWRWGTLYQFPPFYFARGTGLPIVGNNPSIFYQTNQDVDIGIARYRQGEEHPTPDFTSLLNNESIRTVVARTPGTHGGPPNEVTRPRDVVFWYSGTSYEPTSDLFFKHGSFFNPDFHQQMMVPNPSGGAFNSPATQDGIRSIQYGHVYRDGSTTFSTVDSSSLPPLPAGYAHLDNLAAYRIETDAIVSGPHVIAFDVPSVNDQTVFNDLAIFYLEPDRFDPDNLVWVDDTIRPPDTPPPDFANRIISARVNDVGYFAIGKLVQAQPDPGSSDLSVTASDSPDPVVVENNLTYTLHVTNTGPQTATGVGVIDSVPPEVAFVSVSSSQGTCKFRGGSVYCKLGTLTNGSSADVTIVVNPREDRTGVPSQGESIPNIAVVAADNDDANLDNNSATESTLLLPNPNSRPIVSITAPTNGTTYVGPISINVEATATDSDGTVSQVEFYDSGSLVGNGTSIGSNRYQLTLNAGYGSHTFTVVATDNGGRSNTSDSVSIFVNGIDTINITSPSAGTVLDPSSNVTISANVTNPSPISKVEFFADAISIGEGSLTGTNQYSVTWNTVPLGVYTLRAVLTDSFGIITNSLPINITVTSRPSVTIVSPVDGVSYPLLSRVAIMATAQDSDGFVSKVDFYANGSLIGTGAPLGQDQFVFDWTQVPTGIYSLTAIATDNLGVSTTSQVVNIGVNTPSPLPGEFVWFDDALPAGATPYADGDAPAWEWVDANPGSFSGSKSHQSRNRGQFHQHYFLGATISLPVTAGDRLFCYVFLDANIMPGEIMLQWHDGNDWEHRAYWGANNVGFGVNGTNSRRYMGPLPNPGHWVRLEVPASAVGVEGSTVSGMGFTLDAGRATWDLAGKLTANAPPPPTTPPGDFVWVEDAVPAGATLAAQDDHWDWVSSSPPPFSAVACHRSFLATGTGTGRYRNHSFSGATTPMIVNPGDVLFTYAYLDPTYTPDQIILSWNDGTSWSHTATWGRNFIDFGATGTEGNRLAGGLPPAGQWVRLEIPASYVGLEGKTVRGMSFGYYKQNDRARVSWDRSGKSSQSTTTPLPLSAVTPMWRFYNGNTGYFYSTNYTARDGGLQAIAFYPHPNQAAGTAPLYRFRNSSQHYFYTLCRTCPEQYGWTYDGIAGYVFGDSSTPGSVPLHQFHNSVGYFFTANYAEGSGMVYDGIVAYVFSREPAIPAAPSILRYSYKYLNWQDNSGNESGSKIERWDSPVWSQIATVGDNVTTYEVGLSPNCYRVAAFNAFGNSGYSNPVCTYGNQPDDNGNTPPVVSIVNLSDGDGVSVSFTITANAFDAEGAGTISKVEFFADGVELSEVRSAPYILPGITLVPGTHVLTVRATDTSGAMSVSNGVVITAFPPPPPCPTDADSTFEAAPENIAPGDSSHLSWNVPNASRISIFIDDGTCEPGTEGCEARALVEGADSKGEIIVSPETTTTYLLLAEGESGCERLEKRVTIALPPGADVCSPDAIFSADPALIPLNAQDVTLSWYVPDAVRVSIADDSGEYYGVFGIKDRIVVSPESTTTYTLTAYTDQAGECAVFTMQTTVTVGGG